MAKFIWCKQTRKWITKPRQIMADGAYYMPDITEFRTTDGVGISSRAHLREYEKRTGLEQIGNDTTNPIDSDGCFTTKWRELPDIRPVVEEAMRRHS